MPITGLSTVGRVSLPKRRLTRPLAAVRTYFGPHLVSSDLTTAAYSPFVA